MKKKDRLDHAVRKVSADAKGLGCAYLEAIVNSLLGGTKGKVTCCNLHAQLHMLENAMALRIRDSKLSAIIKRELHLYRIGVIESIKKAFEPPCDAGGRLPAALTRDTLQGVHAAYCKTS